MARCDTAKRRVAREIVAGRLSLTAPELMALAYDLREENQIGYARRIYRVALSLAPPEPRDRVQIKLALATCKNPGLPVDDRLKTAFVLDLLADAERGLTAEPGDASQTRAAESSRIRMEYGRQRAGRSLRFRQVRSHHHSQRQGVPRDFLRPSEYSRPRFSGGRLRTPNAAEALDGPAPSRARQGRERSFGTRDAAEPVAQWGSTATDVFGIC